MAAAPTFSCDSSLSPVIVVQMPARWLSPGHLAACLREMTDCHRLGCIVFVVDVRGAAKPNATQRAVIASAVRDAQKTHPGSVRAIAVVANSTLAKGIFVALDWLAPQRRPLRFFTDRDAAIRWASGLFASDHATKAP